MSAGFIKGLVIYESTVSLIKPIVLQSPFLNPKKLTTDFSFLGSLSAYSDYYKKLEHESITRGEITPIEVQSLGSLKPISSKHTLHSYWRYFRLTIKKSDLENKDLSELFLLLPLELKIPLEPIKIDKHTFEASITTLLFPFGVCQINLNVKINNLDFSELGYVIRNLKGINVKLRNRNNIITNYGTFNNFSHEIACKISSALFGALSICAEYSAHTFIFVRGSSVRLQEGSNLHKRAIAAAMTGRSLTDMLSKTNEVIDSYFQAKFKYIRNSELLYFNNLGSFFYADPDWQALKPTEIGKEELEDISKDIQQKRRANCMRNNYRNCLNVLFAVNRFLNQNSLVNQTGINPEQALILKKAFLLAFSNEVTNIYYDHVFTKISPIVGLKGQLERLKGT